MSGPAEDSRAYPWELKPGARVNRWCVLARLGSGSYGVVYRVEAVDAPGVTYALKLALRPADTRAEREEALLARTEHPNVVRVHDRGTWQGVAGTHLYFVMDEVQGLPLHTWVETANPPLRELARVASTLAQTLDWLHARGVRHRDLKPEHILIRASDSQPILIDFGVGRQEGASTLTSTVVPPGTAHMRSPEAVDFHRLNYRKAGARYTFLPTDDLYALGVCLFRALTGHYPFPPDLPGDLLMLAIAAHVPLPVAVINPRVPPAFSEVVARLLAKKPQARHGSGHELHLALEAALALGSAQAWEARVFAWEEGSELAEPSRRRTVIPDMPVPPATPAPRQGGPARRGSTTGRRVFGAMLLPVSAPEARAVHELTLVRAGTVRPWERSAGAAGRGRLPREGRAVAMGMLMLLGLVALLATWRGGGAVAPAEPLEMDSPVAPPGGTREPEAAAAPRLVASPANTDAAPMTQPKDTTDVKTSTPSRPLAKKRSKTPEAVRAAAAAACVGAACAGPQQTEPARTLAALRQPRPPPEECPQAALDAMKELQFGKAGVSTPDVNLFPIEPGLATVREGAAVMELDEAIGTLPRHGTTVVGRLFFAEGRIHGRFTEARTRDGRRFPVCMVLLDGHHAIGWEFRGVGEEPGTVIVLPIGKVRWVKHFK
ncbi:serine/threonine-protein kinase [Myxococcus sp. RHSTA-1-4]|uniref:serine/threonine protein kinase n=1 Tax=Myxococcus sp. RHSTA-1-4 TaxID=2874601 RepID=UPI001CBB1D80|nr:serine/threonine-protein kinase [Myxococcus sp. RHSTA-1-4]MBZ4422815.1 protein kinase [Myxococcus sp. RHSTA-1-4]